MIVVTAVEKYEPKNTDICVFLAGGITNCPDWQNQVIEELGKYSLPNLVVFNPRREHFPTDDPNASEEQIKWEFHWLERMHIFSMYFSAGESVQPICMYELGRNLVRMKEQGHTNRCIISVEKGYKRESDVVIQTKLAIGDGHVILNATPKMHAQMIVNEYLNGEYPQNITL